MNADARVVAQIVQRAGSPGFERWWDRVTDSGYCTNPVHLVRAGARPDGQVLARCKNRRAAVCPSCSRLYSGDTWQLIHRGLAGDHAPDGTSAVFATLTAPGFGAVHRAGPCHPREQHRCRHGMSTGCGGVHAHDDELVGTPLCVDCYDYLGHVLFTWHAPQLWHRFTIALRRAIRHSLLSRGADASAVRLSYVKIVELQRRGVPHYHAILRLDRSPDQPVAIGDDELPRLVIQAAGTVQLRVPDVAGRTVVVRFGQQIDVQPLGGGDGRERAVAGYLAKYVTKSVHDLGLSARRLSPAAIDRLDVSEHVRRILHTIVQLAADPDRRDMLRWLHTLGYRGHVTSKTRHYSTTMTALRAQRATWRASSSTADASDEGQAWEYAGNGHPTDGDRYLVASAARRAIEQQQAARAVLRDLDGGAP